MNRKRGEGPSLKGGKEGWGFVPGGPPCAALERREFQKVILSNLFYLSLEVGREKVNMIFALVFPTKLSTFLLSHSEGSVPHPDFNDGNNLCTPALH